MTAYTKTEKMGRVPPFLGLLLVMAMLHAGIGVRAEDSGADTAEPYRIQPGDVLNISVWKEPDLQAEVLVRPDGGLSFPLTGEHKASGQTLEELKAAIEERLRKFVPDPLITIMVRALGGNRIYVVGKVGRPGEFPFSRPLDVMQALSLAGGATPFADVNGIKILRREDGRQIAIPFRYAEVKRGLALEQNVLLKSGDTVVVP